MSGRTLATVAAVAIVAACGGAAGDAAWAGSVRDSAGIQIVENTEAGIWSPDQAWQATIEVTIGTASGEPEYEFGQINGAASIAVTSDGQIVVLDSQGQHLKVFTADGEYIRTIGGPGGGPGEIGPAAQSSLLMAPGDTLFMVDSGNQRINLYTLDGTFIRSFPLDFTQGLPFRWERAADGRIVAQMRHIAFPGVPEPTDSMDALVVRQLDGEMGDTLMRIPSGETFQFTGGAPEWNFFVPEPAWTLMGNQVLFGINNMYRFGIYNTDGSLARIISKPFVLNPVTGEDEQVMRDAFQELIVEQGAPPQIAAQLAENRLHFAANYPAFGQMLQGPDSTILVQHIQPVSTMSAEERESFDFFSGSLGSRGWDVFDRDGRFLGVVQMPLRFQPVQFVGNMIYGVQRDDLDVQYVVRVRLEAASE